MTDDVALLTPQERHSPTLGAVHVRDLREFAGVSLSARLGSLVLHPVAIVDADDDVRVMAFARLEDGLVHFDVSWWGPPPASEPRYFTALNATAEHVRATGLTPLDLALLGVDGGPGALRLLDDLMGANDDAPAPDPRELGHTLSQALDSVRGSLQLPTHS